MGDTGDTRRAAAELTRSVRAAYDAFYLLAYAVLSLGSRPVDGPAIGSALARMSHAGAPLRAGEGDMSAALAALSGGETLALSGSSGALDLDPGTGEWAPDFRLLCPEVDAQGRATTGDRDSGVRYVPRTHKVTGSLACP